MLAILVNVDKEMFNPSPFSVLLYNIEFKNQNQKQVSNFSTNHFGRKSLMTVRGNHNWETQYNAAPKTANSDTKHYSNRSQNTAMEPEICIL